MSTLAGSIHGFSTIHPEVGISRSLVVTSKGGSGSGPRELAQEMSAFEIIVTANESSEDHHTTGYSLPSCETGCVFLKKKKNRTSCFVHTICNDANKTRNRTENT